MSDFPEANPPLRYQRARFATRLPTDRLYAPSHVWLIARPDARWRVGLTTFATRLLGEVVELGFSVAVPVAVTADQTIGWMEGFKGISDLSSPVTGQFAGSNPDLVHRPDLINLDPYGAGWLCEMIGSPSATCVPASGYVEILDRTIDQLQARSQVDPGPSPDP